MKERVSFGLMVSEAIESLMVEQRHSGRNSWELTPSSASRYTERHIGNGPSFETSQPTLVTHLLQGHTFQSSQIVLPTGGAKYSNIGVYRDHSHSNHHSGSKGEDFWFFVFSMPLFRLLGSLVILGISWFAVVWLCFHCHAAISFLSTSAHCIHCVLVSISSL